MRQKRPSPTHKDSSTVARRLPSPAGRRARDEGAALPHEQTIAASLPLPLGEDRGEGAKPVAEILEA